MKILQSGIYQHPQKAIIKTPDYVPNEFDIMFDPETSDITQCIVDIPFEELTLHDVMTCYREFCMAYGHKFTEKNASSIKTHFQNSIENKRTDFEFRRKDTSNFAIEEYGEKTKFVTRVEHTEMPDLRECFLFFCQSIHEYFAFYRPK